MNKTVNKRSIWGIFLQIFCFFAPLAQAAKLAIVIDDIGYRQKEDNAIYALPKEVSVAIIPVAPNATARAKQAFSQNRDILIHLPMQPKNSSLPIEREALLVGMNDEQVTRLIESARHKVPYAIGLNNHMGSRATTDKATMQQLMKILAEEKLFFLDSKTAGDSVAVKTAQAFGVKALERHIFLDDEDSLANTQQQFQRAIDYARRHGSAIMIGHPRKHSITALQQGLATLPTDIQLVSIGSLWREEEEPIKPFILQFEMEAALTSQAPFHAIPLLRGVPKE